MQEPAKKKQYEAPKLVRYGDLVEVTRATISGTRTDNAAHGPNKTG